MAREAEERKRREEEAQFMAEQQRLRDEAQRAEQEKEAQERARAEQEENERLQKQASDFVLVQSVTLGISGGAEMATFRMGLKRTDNKQKNVCRFARESS